MLNDRIFLIIRV